MKQIKMLLLVGIVVLLTACGGGSSGSSGSGSSGAVDDGSNATVAAPAEILEQALHAQANGDIDSFLSKCALKGQSQQDIDQTRSLFKSVDDQITFSNFSFEPVASGIYGEGDLAVVRAITSFTINGDYQERGGVLSYLKKEDGQWKILRIFPDAYLDLEIDEQVELSSTSNNIHALKKDFAAGNPRTMKEINAVLNRIISDPANSPELKKHIDLISTLWNGTFAVVGALQFPPTELAAQIEQYVSVLKDRNELKKEIESSGWSEIAIAKSAEVALGVLRIRYEGDRVTGATFDMLAMLAHKLTYTLEIQRAARRFKAILHNGKSVGGFSIKEEAYLQPYENVYEKMGVSVKLYPDGSYPSPTVKSIEIKKPEAFGYTLPFRVVGVLSYRYESEYGGINAVAELIKILGGKPGKTEVELEIPPKVTDEMLLEVDLRLLVEEVETHGGGDIINFTNNLQTSDLTMGNFGTITCRQGILQTFTVQLKNDISTPEVMVTTFMSNVNELEISEAYQQGVIVPVGETISNIKIYGNYEDYDGVDQKVDLTPKYFNTNANKGDYYVAAFLRNSPNICLDMKIEDTTIASLERNEDIGIGGLTKGNTMLKMLRSGSEEGIEADLMIPITVGEEEIDIPIMKWENWPEPQWCLKDSPEGISGGNYSIEMGDHNIFCTYWGHGVDGIDQLRTEIPYKSDSNPEYGYTGKEDGWAKLYDYDGDLNQTILYKDGEALKSFLFFDDNLPKEELSYADNEITGIVRLWYSNGQQKSLYNFDHGSPIGYHMGWCENGTVNADVHYDDNGKLDGASKTWSCDGNLESCSIYSHGQYIRDCK